MIVASLGSLLLATLLGGVVAALGWGRKRLGVADLLCIGSLGVGMGFGLASGGYFVSLFGVPTTGLAGTELAMAIGLAMFLVHVRAQPGATAPGAAGPGATPSVPALLSLGLGVTFACGMTAFVASSVQSPRGGWDALAIWNMRARHLFRGGEHWRDAFSTAFVHTDYPLLVPGIVARAWTYAGGESVLVPVLVAMLFTFATVGLLGSSVAILRGPTQGVLAALVLLGTLKLIEHGPSQTADVPLAFFFLATAVLLALHDTCGRPRSTFVVLAGMAAGFATWTKNEGLLFLVVAAVARGAAVLWFRGWKVYLAELPIFAAGVVPMVLLVVYLKGQLAPRLGPVHHLVASEGLGMLDRLSDLGRWGTVLRGLRDQIFVFGGNGFIHPVWLLTVYVACVGAAGAFKHRLAISASAIGLCLMLAGYMLVYVLSTNPSHGGPYDLPTYMGDTLSRLLLQLWPSVLFVYFLVASTPDEARA